MVDAETLSDVLFGRPMRLPLLIWIRDREDPLFFITEAAKATGFVHAHVRKELDRFAQIGLVQALPTKAKNDKQFFQRNDECPYWRVVELTKRLVAETGFARDGQPPN